MRHNSRILVPVQPTSPVRVTSSSRCCPPNISPITCDHDDVIQTPRNRGRRVAYSFIRSLLRRTTVEIWHPRTDTTAFLPRFSATAELLVIDLVPHHDPESDSEFPGGCDSRFPQSLLHQFAPIEAFQLRIPLNRVHRRFTPQITQQRVPLFAHRTQPLPAPAGVFARDHADVTGQFFPIAEPQRIAQEHFGG